MKKNYEIDRFASAVRIITRDLHSYARQLLMKKGLTIPQFHILSLLSDKKELKMCALKEHLLVTGPVATKIVDNLIEKGLAKRWRSDKDRREVHVIITDKGKDALKTIDLSKNKFFNSLLNNISQKDKAAFMKIVEKISQLIIKRKN